MEVLHFILGPIVGAIIGAFTNYLALVMLFRPLKPKYIGKFRIPFTPGIVPKHQAALAESLSDTISKNFFTQNDIEDIFLSEKVVESFSDGIYNALFGQDEGGEPVLSKVKALIGREKTDEIVLNAKAAVYVRVHRAVMNADIEQVITTEVSKVIKTRMQAGTFSRLLMNDTLAAQLSAYIGREVASYVRDNDLELMTSLLEGQSKDLSDIDIVQLLDTVGVSEALIKKLIRAGYVDFMNNARAGIAESFQIRDFVCKKINELDPGNIEFLVNQAVKREMNYLIYLGAGLGLVIGLINSFF